MQIQGLPKHIISGHVGALSAGSELIHLRSDLGRLWQMVIDQLSDLRSAVLLSDKSLAGQVILRLDRIDAHASSIRLNCENQLNFRFPLSIPTGKIMAVLNIADHLVQIGTSINKVAKLILSQKSASDIRLIEHSRVREIYLMGEEVLTDLLESFETGSMIIAKSQLLRESVIPDEVQFSAMIAEYIRKNPKQTETAISMYCLIRGLEKFNDSSKQIASAIISGIESNHP